MPETERTSVPPEMLKFHNRLMEICVDVVNGLDPVRGMTKVMAVIGITPPNFKQTTAQPQSTSKVVNVGRSLREIVGQLGSKEEAAKYGLEPVFIESVNWLKALSEVAQKRSEKDANREEEKSSVKEEVSKKKVVPKSKKNKNKKRKRN